MRPHRSDLSLVFQGPCNERTADIIAAARRTLPDAPVILSTWAADAAHAHRAPVDVLVLNDDPGPLPPFHLKPGAPLSNVNRQITSTSAGLSRVTTRHAAKLRTDCMLDNDAAWCLYSAMADADAGAGRPRILACSYYTLHPYGIEALPFHVSDWFQLGTSDALRRFWSVPPMGAADAAWFDHHPHAPGSSYFSRQYRARLAPEQYLTAAYGKSLGYHVPESVDARTPELTAAYGRFLAREFIICSPRSLGLTLTKYARLFHSHYQYYNCVSGVDWLTLSENLAGPTVPCHLAKAITGHGPRAVRGRAAVHRLYRRLDTALPYLKRFGLMPLLGNALALFR